MIDLRLLSALCPILDCLKAARTGYDISIYSNINAETNRLLSKGVWSHTLTRTAAVVLALFSVLTAAIFHSALADQAQFIHFFKNIAMAGGLLQTVAFLVQAASAWTPVVSSRSAAPQSIWGIITLPMGKTMKAIQVAQYGQVQGLELKDVPDLVPNDDQVLINVAGSGVNPIDWKILSGAMKQFIPLSLPYTPGVEVAGTVAAVGKNVHGFVVGDEVFGFIGIVGGYATQAVVAADRLAHKPAGLPLLHASGIPAAALTAWQALHEHANLQSGQTVLIHGAAGGVGSFAVQLARLAGAYVLTTASAGNRDYLFSLGAQQVIDYTAQRFEDVAEEIDVVLDLVGGETQDRSWTIVKRGGVLVSTVSPPDPQKALEHDAVGKHFATRSDGRQLAQIAQLIAEEKLRVEVEVMPLSKVTDAITLSSGGHTRGKRVLDVNR